MTRLNRKLLRDLWALKTQAFAIALVMASGVATLVMSLSMVASLQRTRDDYYERARFAEVFAHVKRAPNAVSARIADIPGVDQVQARVVMEVILDLPDLVVPAVGRLISLDPDPTAGLNLLHLRSGRFPEAAARHETVVSEGFATARRLRAGDTVPAIINGRRQELTIVGIALSPEYIYQIRPGEMVPDDQRFGVFWMNRTEVAAACGLEGAMNDIALTLARDAQKDGVLRRLDEVIAPYGGQGSYGREDQVSNHLLENELVQLQGMASIPPAIFLAVTAFLLHVVISRLVQTQREQIAVLKAFGYTTGQVGAHFLKLVLVLVVAGLVLGVTAGAWLGADLARLYARYFRFPTLQFHLDPLALVLAGGISVGAAVLGALSAVRRAMSLPPAEGMRPEEPVHYRRTLVERLGLQRMFGRIPRMIFRQLERKPVPAAISIVGIALAVAVVVLGSFSSDIVDFAIELQFFGAQRHDASLAFLEPATPRVMHEVRQLPGVLAAEPFRSVPVRLRFGHRSRQLGLLGLPSGHRLLRLIDTEWRETELPDNGIVISRTLAERLGARRGDSVTCEVMEGRQSVFEITVAALLDDISGMAAYIDHAQLSRHLREENAVSGAFLTFDPEREGALFAAIKAAPRVATVRTRASAVELFRALMAENLLRMRLINVIFASIIAFGVVYNAARISLAERSRELATLRVIGFGRDEISLIFLGEVAVLTLAALPLGLVLGRGFVSLAVSALSTESLRFPAIVSGSTYAFAVTTVLAASLLSSLVVRRRLDRLDLLAVLKSSV